MSINADIADVGPVNKSTFYNFIMSFYSDGLSVPFKVYAHPLCDDSLPKTLQVAPERETNFPPFCH